MYSAAIQRYFNEHIHLPYSFFLQPQRFIRHALKKKGAFMATAYNYVEPSEADNEDIIEYLATDFDVMAGNTAGRLCVLMTKVRHRDCQGSATGPSPLSLH